MSGRLVVGLQPGGTPHGIGRQRIGLFSSGNAIGGSAPRHHPIAVTTTALDGSFIFTDVAPGQYLVRSITPASFTGATSRSVIVTTSHGAVVTLLLCPECRAGGSGSPRSPGHASQRGTH